MSYKSTVDIIRTVANEVNPSGRFICGRLVDLSNRFNGDYPIIFLPSSFKTRKLNRSDFNESRIILAFIDQDKPDSDEEYREDLIDRMQTLSELFYSKITENKRVDVLDFDGEAE